MKYRPEIDGLRALAVVPVILYHAGIGLFSGGFIGVDVFFVISGYLITAIIRSEILNQRFSLLHFYERRARRILPALLLVTMSSVVLAWLLLTPVALESFADSVLGVSTFSSNVVFWLGQGYFAEATELMPLIHTWSLGIEEQFYVLFPMFLLLLSHCRKTVLIATLLGLTITSLALSIWSVDIQTNPSISSAAFYMLPMRGWELTIGALIAIHQQSKPPKVTEDWVNSLFSSFGLALIVVPMILYTSGTPFPGISAITPVLGTALVIYYGNRSTPVGMILSRKPMVFMGLISYSMYLWHQVILAFWRIAQGTVELNASEVFTALSLSLGLSYLSWRHVEKPFRNIQFLGRKTILTSSLLALLLVFGAGYTSKLATQGFEEHLAYELSDADCIYVENLDERLFMRGRLRFDLLEVDSVVMGSSRTMQIGTETLGRPLVNLSVISATIEDYIAFVPEAVKKLGASTVYLGADPWLYEAVIGQNFWKSVENLYIHWKNAIGRDEPLNTTNQYLMSKMRPRPNNNWAKTFYESVNLGSSVADDCKVEASPKIRHDGYYMVGSTRSERERAPQIERDYRRQLKNAGVTSNKNSIARRQQYKNLLLWLKKNDIQVVLILTPFHPILYHDLIHESPNLLQLERDFRDFSRGMNFPVIGSYDSSAVGCRASEFYDGIHPKESCMRKVMNQRVEN